MSRLKRSVMTVRHRIGRSGLLLVFSLMVWFAWVGFSGVTSPYELELTSPFLVSPAVLVLGIVAGSFLREQWRRGRVLHVFIVLLLVTAISIPIYANASAAVGGLWIALVGLGALDLREAMQPNPPLPGDSRSPAAEDQALRQSLMLALMLCAGVFLVLDAQAAIALTVPIALVMTFTVWMQSGPPQWLTILLGCVVAAAAVLTVVFLGNRASWPAWLSASESLSSARHTLWSDALSLWATAPIFGSGPGSFTPSSELASQISSLAAVHSLPLQVGSELGAVGAVLLASLFVGGLVFAARGSRPVAFIAIAAWTALAVHSSIDHLEDFPVVALMGGIILGWSGVGAHSSGAPEKSLSGHGE